MKLLLDTNVLISAYPRDPGSVEPLTRLATELIRLANENGHTTYSHPIAVQYDLGNIEDAQARQWRTLLIQKHPTLSPAPSLQTELISKLGRRAEGSNDWVDHNLLAAVFGNAVSALVTEDSPLIQKSKRLGLGERVLHIADAVATIRGLLPRGSNPRLMARQTRSHALNETDPIFDSLRDDYPGFNEWLAKCQQEHRTCWIVEGTSGLAAATIVKEETPAEYGIPGRTLKVAMFKVSDGERGMRYGELLLKAVFDYIASNAFETAYVTVLPKHQEVIRFFENFGFVPNNRVTDLEETVLVKTFLLPPNDSLLGPFEYHVRYGPKCYREDVPGYVIPIVPDFHRLLFPELESQYSFTELYQPHPYGNSILKAYLSLANSRTIQSGSLLYFYRSHDLKALTIVGIAEETLVSQSADEIAAFVGKRTVYSHDQITDMTHREVLAILFRQACAIVPPLTDKELRSAGVWGGPPQSIMRIPTEGKEWIQTRVAR